jgi:hypothetical protein
VCLAAHRCTMLCCEPTSSCNNADLSLSSEQSQAHFRSDAKILLLRSTRRTRAGISVSSANRTARQSPNSPASSKGNRTCHTIRRRLSYDAGLDYWRRNLYYAHQLFASRRRRRRLSLLLLSNDGWDMKSYR